MPPMGRRSNATMAGMAQDEVDEQLAMLCHLELAGGEESLAAAISELRAPNWNGSQRSRSPLSWMPTARQSAT